MPPTYNVLEWAPLLIGFMFSVAMYGIAFGQSIYYFYWFPDDSNLTKLLVLWIFSADTAHMIGTVQLFWALFISCHGGNPRGCNSDLPWGGLTMTCLNTILCFTVQSFYCRRIWIISEKNKLLTLVVSLSALSGLVSGVWYNADVGRVATVEYLFQCPLILPISITGTVCDILISSSIFKYMWRSGFRRQRTIIQDMAVICMNMGVFTCLVSIITGVMFLSQGNGFWVASVGLIISQSYVNSMMAALNARKVVRERDVDVYDLSTI